MTNLTSASTVAYSRTSPWIRGVNLGGWLVIERYIVPYQYAITDCHLAGNFCWYPGALSAPPSSDPIYRDCSDTACQPVRDETILTQLDYPIDEWNLASAFVNKSIGENWLNYHFEHFLKKQDLIDLKKAGVTHVRVPLPHWILGNVQQGEPWIVGKRWEYFFRMCEWARELELQVWPNIHTAPGSQNGFDNSGVESPVFTCEGWDHSKQVERTLDVLHDITHRIATDGLLDVVTGFGLLNEPFGNCNDIIYRDFLDVGLDIARKNLGPQTNIYVSDKFYAPLFNDGSWWLDAKEHARTYLDTHFYHVFEPKMRAFDTKEHIQLVCEPEDVQLSIKSCCYEDAPYNTTVSQGVKRISTEWSAAFDSHPGELLKVVMKGIARDGIAPNFHRKMEDARKQFLKKFVQAQIVAYEAAEVQGLSDGWFYWNFKIEGGIFAEWDFLRGVQEGWIPKLAGPETASQDVYGTCNEILQATENRSDVVHPFPWLDEPYWRDGVQDEPSPALDVPQQNEQQNQQQSQDSFTKMSVIFFGVALLVALVSNWYLRRYVQQLRNRHLGKRSQYTQLDDNFCVLPTDETLSCSSDSSLSTKQKDRYTNYQGA